MSDHNDFLDEYRNFEKSRKESNDKKPPYRSTGCAVWLIIWALTFVLLFVYDSCTHNTGKNSLYGLFKWSCSDSSNTSTAKSSDSDKSSYSSKSKTESSTVQPTTTKATYKSYSSKSKSSNSEDEFSAKDYVDADDFYYDHYDDFYDYEDAEDYYNEHADQ